MDPGESDITVGLDTQQRRAAIEDRPGRLGLLAAQGDQAAGAIGDELVAGLDDQLLPLDSALEMAQAGRRSSIRPPMRSMPRDNKSPTFSSRSAWRSPIYEAIPTLFRNVILWSRRPKPHSTARS